jgi:hypothetical protein
VQGLTPHDSPDFYPPHTYVEQEFVEAEAQRHSGLLVLGVQLFISVRHVPQTIYWSIRSFVQLFKLAELLVTILLEISRGIVMEEIAEGLLGVGCV